MQVYKAFLRIVRKRIVSVCIYFGIFIGIAIAMGKAGQDNDAKNFSSVELKIAVENLDEGELGTALTDNLSKNNKIMDVPEDNDQLLDKIFCREIDYVLYIPKDFTSRFLDGERDGLLKDRKVPSSANGVFADNQIESYLKTIGMYTDSGFTLQESIDHTRQDVDVTAAVEFLDGSSDDQIEPAYYYFQFLPYIFICTMVSAVGPVFMAFNEKDISARNKCSSMSFFNRNIQMITGSVVISLMNWGLLMAVALVLYPEYVASVRGVLSMMNALLEVILALAMAYTAAQLVKKENALSMVSNVFGLSLAFLGGVFVSLDIFGKSVLNVSRFLPTYWYVISNDAIQKTTQFSNFSVDIQHGFAIQGIYCIVILLAGMLVNRMKAKE